MQVWTGRREKRVAKTVKVTGHWSKGPSLPEDTLTENVSKGGARIVTKGELRLGGTVEIHSANGEIQLRGRVVYCQALLDGRFAAGLEKQAEDFKEIETEGASKAPLRRRGNYSSTHRGSRRKARLLPRGSGRFSKRLCRWGISTSESSALAGAPPRGTWAPYRGDIGRGEVFRFRRGLPYEGQGSILPSSYSGWNNPMPRRGTALLEWACFHSPNGPVQASFPCDVRNRAAGDCLTAGSKAYNLLPKRLERPSRESVHPPSLVDGQARNFSWRKSINSRGASCQGTPRACRTAEGGPFGMGVNILMDRAKMPRSESATQAGRAHVKRAQNEPGLELRLFPRGLSCRTG